MDLKISFSHYLKNIRNLKPKTIVNYLSDLNFFLKWLNKGGSTSLSIKFLTKNLNFQNLEDYKNYLFKEKYSKSTIIRRLATIRIFCQFCFEQRITNKNLALGLENPKNKFSEEKEINILLSKFGTFLKNQGASNSTIKNYIADIRQFLQSQITITP